MLFDDVVGLPHIKAHLTKSADTGRIPHAQLFVGPEGSGALAMALAYAQYIICKNTDGENVGENKSCNLKFEGLAHPDMHFAFPVANNDRVKSHAVSNHFMEEWRNFLKKRPYGNLFDWYRSIGIEKKQGMIGVDEAQDIVKKLSLKSYEGGYKVMLVWMAEKMNVQAANKLLKLLEEPPKKTVFILVAENGEQLLQTILSRCQIVHFPPLSEQAVADALTKKGLSRADAQKLAHASNGNFNRALDLMSQDTEDLVFEKWFVQWIRSAFKAKGNKAVVRELIVWAEILAKTGRETQKNFLHYCLTMIRQAMLINYNIPELAYMDTHVDGFKLERFAPFVHGNNVEKIAAHIEDALYHIERNGNAKLVFTDLSIQLTRLLHVSPELYP